MKTSTPDVNETDASEEDSSSLLDLDNNEFNFTSYVVQRSPQTENILTQDKITTRLVNASSPYMLGCSP